jgi:hypothetical protein
MGGPGGGMPTFEGVIRWQSALPIKQALLRARLGDEVGSSAQAKEMLARAEDRYIVALEMKTGMRQPQGGEGADRMKEMMKANTMLKRKGHEPLHPEDVGMQTGANGERVVFFVFSKEVPIELSEKEVEFQTKMGPLEFKRKFKLADMVVNGKLEL